MTTRLEILMGPLAALTTQSGRATELPDGGMVTYQFERMEQLGDPLVGYWLAGGALLVAAAWTFWWYRRELPGRWRPIRECLVLLRLAAFGAALFFFLSLIRRVDQQVVAQSRVAILGDVSQSMAIEDETLGSSAAVSRMRIVQQAVEETPLVEQLRSQHDVKVATFAAQTQQVLRLPREVPGAPVPDEQAAPAPEVTAPGDPEDRPVIAERFVPRGAQTRLGDALAAELDEREAGSGPLAAVVLFTDGQENGGVKATDVADVAAASKIPLMIVGLGSTQPRRNVRVQELIVPARAYPDDKVPVRVLVGAEGYVGRSVGVELYASEPQGEAASVETLVGSQAARFVEEGELVAVEFELEPKTVGRMTLQARLTNVPDDQYANDNTRVADMEVVETNLRVLLVAGGATRDYRFLRNQLQRDPHAEVDVLLQLSPPGISQDARQVLGDFPRSKEELFQYDCIVGFDPDWLRLDEQQMELLGQWVGEEAGGLIVVAGPVHTGSWTQSPDHKPIRALYPVEFQRRLTLLDDGLYGAKTPWPIELTPAGEEAEFLWLADTAEASRDVWQRFKGVFGCYAVKGAKAGAVIYGRYGDPDAGLSAERPVYFAEHFFGAGRVFYCGSGELWRWRAIDPGIFERLTTQLMRHVSQGRILRGSQRGRLLLQRDRYAVGDNVLIRAQVSSAQREPLVVPQLIARITMPTGQGRNLKLIADPNQPGYYTGELTVAQEGSYRLDLPLPDTLDEQLSKRISVSAPDRELANTSRNEVLLAEMARATGGRYYADWREAVTGPQSIANLVPSRAETRIVRGKPDPEFSEWLRRVLLAVLCGTLSVEWLTRRLLRLA